MNSFGPLVRPALMYGFECWPIKRTQVQRLIVLVMRMIQSMRDHMRLDRMKNEVIRIKVKVASIEYKMTEIRPRWFGHVKSSMRSNRENMK